MARYLSVTPLVGWYGGSLGEVDDITGLNVNVIQAILTVGFFYHEPRAQDDSVAVRGYIHLIPFFHFCGRGSHAHVR